MGELVDTRRLRQLETIIDKGMKSFVEVGNALAEIRDSKLYQETHKTFAAYVEDRFGFKKTRAYELIDAAKVVEDLSGIPDKLPNAAMATELAKAPPEEREEIWEDVVENEPEPTAKAVKQRVEAKKETQSKPTRQEVKDSENAERDRIDRWVSDFKKIENKLAAFGAVLKVMDDQQKGLLIHLLGSE